MKTLLTCLIFLLLVGSCMAELYISPSSINLNTKTNEIKKFNLTLNNTHDFKIMDFSFSNSTGFTFPAIELLPNETKSIEVSVLRTESGLFNINSKVSFKYSVEIPIGQQTHSVNITAINYNPSYIVIRKGDKIKWTNNDDIKHTITSSKFDHEIYPDQNVEIQFNDIEELYYQDLVLFYTGTVKVINETSAEKVNNPAYDKILSITLDVTLNQTALEVLNNQQKYNISATGTKEGIIEVRNNGQEIAERISLSSSPNWITFDENNFNIAKSDKNFVTYHISPLITRTEDTNKTYNLTLRAKGSNTPENNLSIEVFVPYENIFNDISTPEGFISFFERYCKANPQILFCNNTISSGSSQNQTIIRDLQIPVNLSATEVYALLKRVQRIEDSQERGSNEVKKLADELHLTVPELLALLNQSVTMQKENEDTSTARTRSFWILVMGITLCSCIIVIALVVRKRRYKKSIIEGGYTTS